MTTAQKIIKYLALAFAAFLIFNIISAILIGINALANGLGLTNEKKVSTSNLEEIVANIQGEKIDELELELQYTNLEIKTGDTFKIESDSENISYLQTDNNLTIKEKKHNWFSNNEASELVIYIPNDIKFEKIDIDAGAGEIDIERLEAKELLFELGAGKVNIEGVNISKEAKIEGGAGNVSIQSGVINDLDLDMGVGKFEITSKLTGDSKIDAGIGEIRLELEDEIKNYTIKANKGIGSVSVNGKELSDGEEYGDGNNYIRVNGGIGKIEISSK